MELRRTKDIQEIHAQIMGKFQDLTGETIKHVDNIPMCAVLYDFFTEYKKWQPRAKPYVTSDSGINFHGVFEVALALPEEMHAMGSIGVKDGKYYVRSHKIRNDKYKTRSLNFHTLASIDIKRAMKNAKTYLRPASMTSEIAACYANIQNELTAAYTEAHKEFMATWSKVQFNELLRDELLHLHRSGHKFINQNIQELVVKMNEHCVESSEMLSAPLIKQVYVRILQRNNREEVLEVLDLGELARPPGKMHFQYVTPFNLPNREHMLTAKNAPEWLLGKISALNMVGMDTYVRGLGIKRGDYSFIVEYTNEEQDSVRNMGIYQNS